MANPIGIELDVLLEFFLYHCIYDFLDAFGFIDFHFSAQSLIFKKTFIQLLSTPPRRGTSSSCRQPFPRLPSQSHGPKMQTVDRHMPSYLARTHLTLTLGLALHVSFPGSGYTLGAGTCETLEHLTSQNSTVVSEASHGSHLTAACLSSLPHAIGR